MTYLIYNDQLIGFTDEQFKRGQEVRVSSARQGKNLINAVYCKTSVAQKWKKHYLHNDVPLAVVLDSNHPNDLYCGDDKPKKIVPSDLATSLGKKVNDILANDELDYSPFMQAMIDLKNEEGKEIFHRQAEVQIRLGCSQHQAIEVMALLLD